MFSSCDLGTSVIFIRVTRASLLTQHADEMAMRAPAVMIALVALLQSANGIKISTDAIFSRISLSKIEERLGGDGEGNVAVLRQGLAAYCVGSAYGYCGMAAVYATIGAIGRTLSRLKSNDKPRKRVSFDADDFTSVAGRWVLDTQRSESLEPFLVAVGAPKLIARMVGAKGKPMDVRAATASGGATTFTIALEGKPEETFSTVGSTDVQTPRGTVQATLSGDARRSFTVTKRGPAEGELGTETRELCDGGRTLKCTFMHRTPDGEEVCVTRYYVRG